MNLAAKVHTAVLNGDMSYLKEHNLQVGSLAENLCRIIMRDFTAAEGVEILTLERQGELDFLYSAVVFRADRNLSVVGIVKIITFTYTNWGMTNDFNVQIYLQVGWTLDEESSGHLPKKG